MTIENNINDNTEKLSLEINVLKYFTANSHQTEKKHKRCGTMGPNMFVKYLNILQLLLKYIETLF